MTIPTSTAAATAMTARLRGLVTDYLQVRRSLGYKLEYTERLLFAFVDYLHTVGAQAATVEHAVGFAMAPPGASPRWQALRLSAVRCFARWAQLQDLSIQVPSPRLLPARVTRAAPYIYSDTEIAALLDATGQLHPQIRAITFHTLIALMAATGIRTGEALGLDVTDFDQRASTLTVTGKYGKTRRLPLHPSVRDGLIDYLLQRQRLLPAASCPALLITARGTRLKPQLVHPVFRALADGVGLTAASSASRPRLHDLRHRFAVVTMLAAYRSGQDPAAALPILATWLGHADPSDTYWYLTGTAELLAAATDRLDALTGHGEGERS
ncbi:MAG: tyrosine-type recombinase/integrase [Actinobacteria bacterium]|nr:tyrosine-type recombinase/integrase [Actinomycetota bacterium]